MVFGRIYAIAEKLRFTPSSCFGKTIPASLQMRAGRYSFGYGLCLLLHLHHTAEAHESHGKDTCGDESNGDASHTLG